MRSYFFIILALAVGGIAASVALIPRGQEVALMNFLDAEYESAQQEYQFQILAGNWSINVVVPLTQLYLQDGEPEKAADLMAEFVDRNPNDLEARLTLGQYLQFAERPDAYLENLIEIIALEPTEARYRELSDIYSFNSNIDQQIAALNVLTTEYQATPDEFKALAALLADRSRYRDAIATLQLMNERYPESFDADVIALYVRLLLEDGRPGDARDVASSWIMRNNRPPEIAALLANQFAFKGFPEDGLNLLRPLTDLVDDNGPLLAQFARLQSDLEETEEAYERLKRLYASERLPQEAADILIDLSLERDESELALAVAESVDLSSLPTWLMVSLAETAVSEGRADFAKDMIARLGPEFLANRPALAAEIFLAAGDLVATRNAVARAEEVAEPLISESSSLARVYVRLGEYDAAIDLLTNLVMEDAPDPGLVADLVRVYRGAERAADGAEFFESLRSASADPIIDISWAILAAEAGKEAQVVVWLDGLTAATLPSQSDLLDLHFIAGDRQLDELRLATAERLYSGTQTDVNQGRLSRAILDARLENRILSDVRDVIEDRLSVVDAATLITVLRGRGDAAAADLLAARGTEASPKLTEEVLRSLRNADFSDRAARAAYVAGVERFLDLTETFGESLRQAARAALARSGLTQDERAEAASTLIALGDPEGAFDAVEWLAYDVGEPWSFTFLDLADELGERERAERFLVAQFQNARLSQGQRDGFLFVLIEDFGPAPALPFLRQNAEARGGSWIPAYTEALRDTGQLDTLKAFLTNLARDTGQSPETRRAAAFQLLEDGHRDEALNTFLSLAEGQGADSPDVNQALFLWGPRPGDAAADWLMTQLRRASGPTADDWFRVIVNTLGPERAMARMSQADLALLSTDAAELELSARLAADDRDGFVERLDALAADAESAGSLQTLGRLAFHEGYTERAFDLYRRANAAERLSGEALRQYAHAGFFLEDFERAGPLLRAVLQEDEADADTHQFLGDIAVRAGQETEAETHYRRALTLLSDENNDSFEHRRRLAFLAARTGALERAFGLYERLVAEAPDLRSVRAEYASVLIENGFTTEAEALIGRSSTPLGG